MDNCEERGLQVDQGTVPRPREAVSNLGALMSAAEAGRERQIRELLDKMRMLADQESATC